MNQEEISTKKDVDSNATDSNNDLEDLRRTNFDGKIPVKLTLAQTSLSSSVLPQPRHSLVSRQTFLHVGLEQAVRKLHEYALPTLSFLGTAVVVQEDDSDEEQAESEIQQQQETAAASQTESTSDQSDASTNNINNQDQDKPAKLPPYPVCWFEDIATGTPLRWQYFAGVLFDSLSTKSNSLPWEIRLHFSNYPNQLLELCDANLGHSGVLETIRMVFRNSLKQAFVIRYGNSKEALNLSKQSHDSIWEGILGHDFDKVAKVIHRDDEFETEEATTKPTNDAQDASNLESGEEMKNEGTTTPNESNNDTEASVDIPTNEETISDNNETNSNPNNNKIRNNNLVMLPVRLSVDPTKPMMQKRFEGGTTAAEATLGTLLQEWVPHCMENDNCIWKVAGLTPPLSTPLLDLWLALRHPDNFLYISLSTPQDAK